MFEGRNPLGLRVILAVLVVIIAVGARNWSSQQEKQAKLKEKALAAETEQLKAETAQFNAAAARSNAEKVRWEAELSKLEALKLPER